ncbi:BnaC05g47700D [Brassica napus]|uniref:BnaC05g47700D protein n=2 Tax=Brassica TaxID=3705 RepID=A0A078JBE1_BRANA|nr:hypothetical protein F2Q69_00032456 [Brassica cretica]CDY64903.1 BnaC05g47700D [Brassica napus]
MNFSFIFTDFKHKAVKTDLLGVRFNVKATLQGNTFKIRVPFPRRAQDRKDVKTLIVEMLQAAKSVSN